MSVPVLPTDPAPARRRRITNPDVLRALQLVALAVLAMWVIEGIDAALPADLDRYGIEPRDTDGLPGVVAAPFLHGGFGHLLGNTLPFVVLGAAIALGGVRRVLFVSLVILLVAGLGVWLFAPAGTIHLGASGIVFGYATYLAARGVWSRHLGQLAFGVLVVLVWGTTLLGGLVPEPGVSWQGHLFGAVGGIVAAWLVHRRRDEARGGGDADLRPA